MENNLSILKENQLILEKGISCLKIAAKKSDAVAQFILGSMHEKGEHVEQSKEKAFEPYQLAAKQGHKEAQEALEAMKESA